MLLLRSVAFLLISIGVVYCTIAQVNIFNDNTSSEVADFIMPSLVGEYIVVLNNQEIQNKSVRILDIDNNNIVGEFNTSFTNFAEEKIMAINCFDNSTYTVLLSCNDNSDVNSINDRKLILLHLNKNLADFTYTNVADFDEGLIMYNPTSVYLNENTIRYYYSLNNPNNGFNYILYSFDYNIEDKSVTIPFQSEVNPWFIYRDTEYFNGLLYFSDFNSFNVRTLNGQDYEDFSINWPKSGNNFHDLDDLHFEILSNGRIVFSGQYEYDFNEHPNDIHGIAVYNVEDLDSQYFQHPPVHFYKFDGGPSTRAFINSISKIPNTDETWVYGANVDINDPFFGPLPETKSTLFLTKLNSEGEKDFTIEVPMEGYAFPTNCTSDKDGNVYATGFIYNEEECVFRKGFVVKLNSEGELSSSVEIPLEDVLSVYPNPVSDKLYLDGIGRGRYKLMTIEGKVVETGDFDNQVIDMSHLTKGPYIVAIEQEGQIVFKKIIKE